MIASPHAAASTAHPGPRPCRSAPARTRTDAPDADTILGCLLGGALGDALGAPIEFESAASIARRELPAPPADLAYAGSAPARITDDTQMTLFVAEGLIRARQRQAERGLASITDCVQHALVRWYATQTGEPTRDPGWLSHVRGLHARRAPGNTCMSALAALARNRTLTRARNDSKGCGAVMRAAPFGLACTSRTQAFELARDTGAMTHGHPSGTQSAGYLAALVFDVARGASLPEAMTHADALLAGERDNGELIAILARCRAGAATGAPPSVRELEALGGGWVGEEALAIALRCVLAHDPSDSHAIERTLWAAVAHGGDSDSTGAIAGNLLGAMLGAAPLPARWLAQLELRPEIARVADDLHRSITGARLSPTDYPPS